VKVVLEMIDNGSDNYTIFDDNGNPIVNNWCIPDFKYTEYVDNADYIKDVVKLKESGFTAEEIIELIGRRNG
jgi:hypothetical protein